MSRFLTGLAVLGVVAAPTIVAAQDLDVVMTSSESSLALQTKADTYKNYRLTVIGPNGFHAVAFSEKGIPEIDLQSFGDYDDGAYQYQLTASSEKMVPLRTPLDNGRGRNERKERMVGVATSGSFSVENGAIVEFSDEQEK